MNRYLVLIMLVLAVMLSSGCVSGSKACITDCMMTNTDIYEEYRDICIEDSDRVYVTIGVDAVCIVRAHQKLERDCQDSCRDIW